MTAPRHPPPWGSTVNNEWLRQFFADLLEVPVERPMVTETTTFGAAYRAGLHLGLFGSTDEIAGRWQCERRFEQGMDETTHARLIEGLRAAVARIRTH